LAEEVNDVRVTTLAGEPALVMPYARAIKHPDKAEQQVQEAIDRMVSRGYCHNDLDWRHVGMLGLRQHRQQRVIFFDLVDVSRVDTYLPEAVTAAKTKMLQALGLGD
jgi:hypothetical protein